MLSKHLPHHYNGPDDREHNHNPSVEPTSHLDAISTAHTLCDTAEMASIFKGEVKAYLRPYRAGQALDFG